MITNMTNSSSDKMIWVKEVGDEAAAFRVFVSPNAIVDDLKDAIKNKMVLTYGAPLLKIKIKTGENYEVQGVGKAISDFAEGKTDADPIYYSQPEPSTCKNIKFIF